MPGIFVMLMVNICFGQSTTELISTIKKEFQAINADSGYKKIVIENEDFLENMTDGGGALTGYYKGKRLRKINQWIGISTGFEITEFYYKDNKLIFIYQEFNSFIYIDSLQELDHSQATITSEKRFYFNNDKLIQFSW